MATRPSISMIGAGNLARALAVALRRAGYRIDEIVARPTSLRRAQRLARQVGAHTVASSKARLSAEIVWFCVNDDSIRGSAEEYEPGTTWKGKIALHSSGALGSDELRALKRRGAASAAGHPKMTFLVGQAAHMRGVAFPP